MPNTPHQLHEEFPEHAAQISALKTSDAHFARMAEEYHEINRAVHRAEALIEPVEELTEVDMRKQRAALKDQIYAYLKK